MSVRFEMRLPDQVASAVDAVRGDVPRAKWVLRAVVTRLDQSEPLEVAAARGPAMTPEELDPYFDAIQEQVKPPVRPPARKAQPAHPSVPRPAKRSIALPEDEPKRSMPVPASLEQFKCSVCGLRTVGGPCQKHPKSSERVT